MEAARRIKRDLPEVEILLFSGTHSPYALLQMYRSEVGGCLLKSENAEELHVALKSLRQHQRFRSRQITALCEGVSHAGIELHTLTPRETAIVCLIAEAKSSKEMVAQLGVSLKTVETHRTNLFHKSQSPLRRRARPLRSPAGAH